MQVSRKARTFWARLRKEGRGLDNIAQYIIYPAMLLFLGKWIDYKIDQNKKKLDASMAAQAEELARRQQREAERDLKIEQMQDGIRSVLRDRILQSCNYFITRGSITPLALENITMMHDSYKMLHGNGLCDKQFKTVNELPLEVYEQNQRGRRDDTI